MASSLRVSLLALLLAGTTLPLAGLAWIEYQGMSQEREEHEATRRQAAALAAALRAESAGGEGVLEAAQGAAPAGEEVFLVRRDGSYRAGGGAAGQWPELTRLAADRVSGVGTAPHPATGAETEVAWARAPSVDALVVLARPPSAPAGAVGVPFLLLAAFLGLGILLLLSFVASQVVAPVGRLETASRRLTRGEWHERVPVEGPAETRALAAAFNAMAEALQRQRAQLDALLEERTRDLIDREGDLDALRFTLAHEFREPLRSLRWMADDLLDAPLEAGAREGVLLLRRRIDDLDAVFRDLLRYEDVSRRAAAVEQVDLDDVLRAAEREAGEAGPLRVVRGPLPPVRGQRDLLALAFTEVLRNVAQHARPPRGPAVARVVVDERDGRLVLHVDDEGPGIPARRRDDVLNLFQRLRRDVPGTGAGLAIARRAVERHGGTLTLGEAPGGGTRVTIELPTGGPPGRTPLPQEPRRRRF